MAWKKQLIFAVIVMLAIAGSLYAAEVFPSEQRDTEATPSPEQQLTEQISTAIERYHQHGIGDTAILRKNAGENIREKAEIVMRGLSDIRTMRSMLSIIAQNDLTASFFVSASDVEAYPASLSQIVESGYSIGIAIDQGTVTDDETAEGLITKLVTTGEQIQQLTGIWPAKIMAQSTKDTALAAIAFACNMDTIVIPSTTLQLDAIDTQKDAETQVAALKREEIVCIELPNRTDANWNTNGFSAFCLALANTDLQAYTKELLARETQANEPITQVYTTERAVAFTFYGLGNDAELQSVLEALDAVSGKATFFVSQDDINHHPEEISQVLLYGHSLGIAVQTTESKDAATLLEEMLSIQENLSCIFHYTDALPVRTIYGYATEMLKQACGAGGFTLVSAMVNAVRSDDTRATDAQAIVESLLPKAAGVLQRGEIVHFLMNQYQKSDELLGQLVLLIATERNIYSIKPILAIVNNTDYVYQYPLADSDILPEVLDKIYPGQMTGDTELSIELRYIGTDWVSVSQYLPGFTKDEIKRLDKTGLIVNNVNRVFLTFDDWGTDQTITAILDVLKAHHAKATFFILTGKVKYNPNLLRAIAVEGHTIGCHSHLHTPLANVDTKSSKLKYTDLTSQQVTELQAELTTSYNVLQHIVGDLKSGDKPSLSLLFRPPTLAVSKRGIEAVLDCGFTFSISGSYSSHDYDAVSAEKLAASLEKNTKSGAILVMHMSDTSQYTAEALDLYLTVMEAENAEEPYQFIGLNDAL